MSKIGIGIITCNRDAMFKRLLQSIPMNSYDELVIINDGDEKYSSAELEKHLQVDPPTRGFFTVHNNTTNLGVGKSKNIALQYLLDQGCDYLFLIEDDMVITNWRIFDQYIAASEISGIQHFMFALHGPANKNGVSKGLPCPRAIFDYTSELKVALYQHCVGAFCMYTRESLEKVGLYDEQFLNAFEHVEHSYRLAKEEFSTPYWWWADLADSYKYIEEQACSEDNSTIRPRADWAPNINSAWRYFEQKHNYTPTGIPSAPLGEVTKLIKKLAGTKIKSAHESSE